jgi:regulator of sirC expression with transglutaminase-like and TPR domain
MLHNLVAVAEAEQDIAALLRYADAILLLDENAAVDRLRRAFLRAQTAQPAAAAEDLDWLLERLPEELDLEEARRLREALRREGF